MRCDRVAMLCDAFAQESKSRERRENKTAAGRACGSCGARSRLQSKVFVCGWPQVCFGGANRDARCLANDSLAHMLVGRARA